MRVTVVVVGDLARSPRTQYHTVAPVRRSRTLLWRVGPDVILVQNPPALPTLASALLAARVDRARPVIPKPGYTMLALRLGSGHPAVRLTPRDMELARAPSFPRAPHG